MAIAVDKVYRTVLSILNKESRGLVTPDEFNKIARQAQMSVIDSNIDGYNRAMNKKKNYSSNSGYGDNAAFYREKLEELTDTTSVTFSGGLATLPSNNDFYRLLGIYGSDGITMYEELPRSEVRQILSSPLATPMAEFPVYYFDDNGQTIYVKPNTTALDAATVSVEHIEFPSDPRWGYLKNSVTGAYNYDANPYVATGLVVKEDAFTTFTTNISNGVDGTFSVEADISTGGTIDLSVTVSGNIVTTVETVEAGTGFIEGTTLTVGTYIGAPVSGDLEVTGVSSDLVITVGSSNIYSGSTAGSTNFLLHPSDEVKLIETIMAYAGITIRDPQITQQAIQLMQSNQASEQNS